ncbi:MAG: hypothetical protein IT435_14905 [Phycisphaerales bacterium]|nr:hypothetical protein [Phycisphaerales bacterium]
MLRIMHAAVVAICLAGFLSRSALAQPIWQCPNYGDGSVDHLEENESWIQDLSWMSNRMPGVHIAMGNAHFCVANTEGNAKGLLAWWCDEADDSNCSGSDGVEELITRLEGYYTTGFRRFNLYLPAGMVVYHEYVSSSQWLPMPSSKRAELENQLADWITTKGNVEVEVYGTFQNALPATLCMEPSDGGTVSHTGLCGTSNPNAYAYPCEGAAYSDFPSPFSAVDMCIMYETIGPWHDLGVTRFWLDSGSKKFYDGEDVIFNAFEDFIEIAHSPMYRPETTAQHLLGTEAFPWLLGGSLDMPAVLKAPAMAFPGYLQSNDAWTEWDLAGDSNSDSVDDRGQSELVAILDYSVAYTLPDDAVELLDWARNGFVFYVANPSATNANSIRLVECMKRVYDFGTLPDRRDFDGDGDVDSNDLADFDAVHADYSGTTSGANWIHGDMDQDNDVDAQDALKYHLWYQNFSGTWDDNPINLYNAEPYDILTPPNN